MLQVNDPANNKPDEPRARVFISCGQSKQTDEVETASAIAARLRELGFDPYIAVQEQTLRGLKENIFAQLEKSEYFIFVDFKRERLANAGWRLWFPRHLAHRGSLFSHQELAIASFLNIDVLSFREKGIKTDEGILPFIQANPTEFTDRHLLPSVIADEVHRRHWDPHWRNELVLVRAPAQFRDAFVSNLNKAGRFFHIGVRNLHRHRTATNCYAYLEQATKIEPPTAIALNAVEFKWAGYILPNAHIPPGTIRFFDAFWICHDSPAHLHFNVFSDSTDYTPQIAGEGRYELRYLVTADNFPPVRGSFTLNLHTSIDQSTLTPSTQTTANARARRQQEFFDLARRFRTATDPKEVERLGNEMGRMIFGD